MRKNIYQPKTFENPNTCEKKLIITEHPKPADKFSKTIRQAAKVGCNSALYSDAKKIKHLLNEKNVKIKKAWTCFDRLCNYS